MTLVGPLAREVFARFCAVDLRPQVTPVTGLRPGSIARQPGLIVREAEDRYLFLFGWAVGQYMWTVVEDAGVHLGGRPVGLATLDSLAEPLGGCLACLKYSEEEGCGAGSATSRGPTTS